MTLFCAAIIRDSVSLLKFPFPSHVQGFSCVISLVCRLEYPYSFSSNFCFLIIVVLLILVLCLLFLVAVISLSLLFFYIVFEPSYRCRDAILNAVMWALSIIVSFLVFWFFCWSSSLVHLKNGPEYLKRGTA